MSRSRVVFLWAAVVAWAGFIFFLSSQSHPHFPKGMSVQFITTVGHFALYFVLSALLFIALRGSGWRSTRALFGAIVLSALYALSDEWHQSFVPGREPSVVDLAVDFAGATVAALLARLGSHRLESGEHT